MVLIYYFLFIDLDYFLYFNHSIDFYCLIFSIFPDSLLFQRCFGPEMVGGNVLVDCTRGVQHLADVKDAFGAAFQWASKVGFFVFSNFVISLFFFYFLSLLITYYFILIIYQIGRSSL